MFGYIPSQMCIITRDRQTNPYTYASMVEARQTLDDLLNRIHCLEQYYNIQSVPDISSTQLKIRTDLSLWRKTFSATDFLDNPTTPQDQFGSTLLRVYHEMATIMASVVLSYDEMVFDAYTENFTAVITGFHELRESWCAVKHNQDFVKVMKSPDCGGAEFTVESGFVPPVYYTTLECRVSRIRRQAMRTLRSAPHREGVWNGPLLADALEEVVFMAEGCFYGDEGFEESGSLTGSDLNLPDVPELARIEC
ncbi:hypothetical protein PENDEC_c034G06039 [Penicillium decumbens]|uniref:Uncharacterized protein n=1 Tax=Penicillium decumbens TaxID=69771 RepID=A0A1V6NUZ2_PENDC|nr:hypothetical protein PENDEC_c034G06039 [Penicillium decumbens]